MGKRKIDKKGEGEITIYTLPYCDYCSLLKDTLDKLEIKQILLDPALWYRLREDKKGYDYFSHHVDDFLISGKTPLKWIKELEESYTITGKTEPKIHLGMDFNK